MITHKVFRCGSGVVCSSGAAVLSCPTYLLLHHAQAAHIMQLFSPVAVHRKAKSVRGKEGGSCKTQSVSCCVVKPPHRGSLLSLMGILRPTPSSLLHYFVSPITDWLLLITFVLARC